MDDLHGNPHVFRVNAKIFEIELHGNAAIFATAATGLVATAAGTYLLWKVKDPEKFVNTLCGFIADTTGAVLTHIEPGSLLLTVFAETLDIALRVERACESNQLLEEVNARIKSYNKEMDDDIGQFDFIKIISKNVCRQKDVAAVKRSAAENMKETVKKGLKIKGQSASIQHEKQTMESFQFKNTVSKIQYKPVQIIRPNRDGGFKVDKENLEHVFGDQIVARTPIAIYSIAGAYRTGKSFILNFFLRFLWAKKVNQCQSWLNSDDDELREGFVWKGGENALTSGIWIWNEPFFVNTGGKEVAVFLMDTQGSFDSDGSMEEWSVIFALSTLLSSVQIYNVTKRIESVSLQHLQVRLNLQNKFANHFLFQLFTEYAKAAKTDENKFQELLFLVRDWGTKDCDVGFKGGEQVLKKALEHKPNSHNREAESVKKSLRNSFENISCCVMKHPGDTVMERDANQGSYLQIKEVREPFLDTVDVLVRRLFLDENIVVKKSNRQFLTGIDIINFTLSYSQVFISGKMPTVLSVVDATAKADILTTTEDCKQFFRKQMSMKCNEGYEVSDKLKMFCEQQKRKALDRFEQKPKLGDKEFATRYKKHLSDVIDLEFIYFEQRNMLKLEENKQLARDAISDVEMYFKEIIEKTGSGYVEEKEERRIKEESRAQALKLYQTKTSGIPLEVLEGYRSTKEILIEKYVTEITDRNKQILEQLLKKLEESVRNATKLYKNEMDKKCSNKAVSDEELDKFHQTAQSNALMEFDNNNHGENTNQTKNERGRLMDKIQMSFDKYKQTNKLENISSQTLNAVRQKYRSAMEKKCGVVYLEGKEFNELHKSSKNDVIDSIKSLNEEEANLLLLKNVIDKEKEEFDMRNIEFKERKRGEFKIKMRDAFYMYTTGMDENKDKHKEKSSLEKLHNSKRELSIKEYNEKKHENLSESFDSIRDELRTKIDRHYGWICEINEEMEKKNLQKAEKLMQEQKTIYMESMLDTCDGKYVTQAVLKKIRDTNKMEFRKKMSEIFPKDSTTGERVTKKYKQETKEIHLKYLKQNEKNKQIYFRKVSIIGTTGGAIVGAGMGVGIGALAGGPIGMALGGGIGLFVGGLATGTTVTKLADLDK